MRLERFGVGVVYTLAALMVVLMSTIGLMKLAAADLHNQVDIAHGSARADVRSPIGALISPFFAPDLRADDLDAMNNRAILIDDRSDRLLEATAVVALAGMFAALVTARPTAAPDAGSSSG